MVGLDSIAFSKQKSELGDDYGLVMEYQSPVKKGRSVIVVTAQTGESLHSLGDALLDPGVQARMKGDMSLVRLDVPDYDVNSLSVGKKYSTGDKGNISLVDSFLYAHQYVLYSAIALIVLLLSWVGFRVLRRVHGKRTDVGGEG